MVSPTVDKDLVIVDDEEREAIDHPSKETIAIPTIIIFGSTNVVTAHPKPTDEKLKGTNDGDDNDDNIDFGDLSAFNRSSQLAS